MPNLTPDYSICSGQHVHLQVLESEGVVGLTLCFSGGWSPANYCITWEGGGINQAWS
jgi:hypothetical protein